MYHLYGIVVVLNALKTGTFLLTITMQQVFLIVIILTDLLDDDLLQLQYSYSSKMLKCNIKQHLYSNYHSALF